MQSGVADSATPFFLVQESGVVLKLTGCVLFPISVFVGVLAASAGLLLFPRIAQLTKPMACSGELTSDVSRQYERPGQAALSRQFECIEPDGTRRLVTVSVVSWTFVIWTGGSLALQMLGASVIRARRRQ
ncbi:MAG: hypothetical protein DYH07_06525 [Armatimonadetes bacterium ATM1]|nr:hypothetical protein [Armatimonadota bacterium]MCE7899731.1 hypothetical protein [Armatimonadetes bacterium ATM1]